MGAHAACGLGWAGTARAWSRDAHEAGVLEALAVGRPARAVGLDVLAGGLARLACHRARADHKLGIGVALAGGAPAGALLVDVLALGRAQSAASRAEPKHRVRVGLALASCGPRTAGGLRVVALMRADAAGQGALDRHEFLPAGRQAVEWVARDLTAQAVGRMRGHRIVSHALVIPGPVGAVRALVVADAGEHSRGGQGEGE